MFSPQPHSSHVCDCMSEKQLISQGPLGLLHPKGLEVEHTMNKVEAEWPPVNEGSEQGSLVFADVSLLGKEEELNHWVLKLFIKG